MAEYCCNDGYCTCSNPHCLIRQMNRSRARGTFDKDFPCIRGTNLRYLTSDAGAVDEIVKNPEHGEVKHG